MTTSTSFIQRARAWFRKPLIVCGLVAGLALGAAPAAHAEAWNFSYSGGGINVSGQIIGVWNSALAIWDITSISGTHNGDAITGLWQQAPAGSGDNNYLAGPTFGATLVPPQDGPTYGQPLVYYYDQADLHFIANGVDYAFGYIIGYNNPVATEGPLSNLDWDNGHPVVIYGTGRCVVGVTAPNGCTEITQVQFEQVPEINASAGLEALALLFVFGLIMREMFLRRRDIQA